MAFSVLGRFETIENRIKGIEDTLENILVRLARLEGMEEAGPQSVLLPLSERKDGPYSYRALDMSRNETRILVLYSSPDEQSPIACELLHASLDQNVSVGAATLTSEALRKFNTLSYTWGDVERKGSMILDGHQFPVTENLKAALRQLRNFEASPQATSALTYSFWWIDAICINQEDVLERNQQVNLMTRIYKKAAGVHIWLGEEADNSDAAIQVARQLGDQTPRGPGLPDIIYPETSIKQKKIHRDALVALCERPWWERVWVRQEVAVAPTATVHCGSQACKFYALAMALDILNKMDEQLGFKVIQEETARSSIVWRTSSYRRAYVLTGFRQGMGRTPISTFRDLNSLILHTRACQATDPRDKVFSVLGLADPDFWELKADYRLSITETFTAAARCLISKKQSLDVLSGCQNPERVNGLASWVPNLVDGWKAQPFPTASQQHCTEVMTGEAPDFVFEGEGNCILRARGFYLDCIATLSDETPHQGATADELDVLSVKWRALAATALTNPQAYVLDKRNIAKYNDDGPWVEFLSIHVDRGQPKPKTAAPLNIPGDYRMAKSLLLPSDEEVSAIEVKGLKNKVHEHLRKSGVGRKLCITKMGPNKGSVVLVPADSMVGDEIWLFRGTNFPYVLRQIKKGEYVVVGEAYSDRYYWPYLKSIATGKSEIISIV